jgi:hypothetical protein
MKESSFKNTTSQHTPTIPSMEDRKDWRPSSHEVDVSKYFFDIADVEKVGKLSGKNAVAFLTKSKLDRVYLRQIWELSDTLKQHYLGLNEFQVAMRLVLLAQNGYLPSPTVLNETKDLKLAGDPAFDGVPPFDNTQVANINNVFSGISSNEEPSQSIAKNVIIQNESSAKGDSTIIISEAAQLSKDSPANRNVENDEIDPFASLSGAVNDAPLPSLSLLSTQEERRVIDDDKQTLTIEKIKVSIDGETVVSNEAESSEKLKDNEDDGFGDFADASKTNFTGINKHSSAEKVVISNEAYVHDDFGDFASAKQESDSPSIGSQEIEGSKDHDNSKTVSGDAEEDDDTFGDFNDASDTVVEKASEDTIALNASLIDSFVQKIPSPKNEMDIFSNLADFALTGTPVPNDNFTMNKLNDKANNNNNQNNPILGGTGTVHRKLSVGLAESDLSFLPAMENRGRFEGPLEQLVSELIEQQRFLEAAQCKTYINTLAGASENFAITNAWRDIRPSESIVKFSDLKNQVCEICGEKGLLNKRFCELFPFSVEPNVNELIQLASSDLPKVLLLLRKASLLCAVIVGVNEPMGRYENYPENWMLLLIHCNKEFNVAQAFLDQIISASKIVNENGSFHRHVSISEILKEEKVVKYFKCIFAMYKVCCSLQLWVVYEEISRKKLLSEMEKLKKGWKKLVMTTKKYDMSFPRIKMITYKHINEHDIACKDGEGGEDQGEVCHLCLLPIRNNDSTVIYAGNCYISECVNFWVNSISTTPP